MNGLIGKKIGMTSVYDSTGKLWRVPSLKQVYCVVTQVKTEQTDGYTALQLAYGDTKAKNTSKPLQGHFEKANTEPKHKLVEFRDFSIVEKAIGEIIKVDDVFNEGDMVHAVGVTKGKGFQGVVKRYGFSGVGGATHGQHNRQRAPGSMGASSYPSRVFKGKRLPGRTGGDNVKVKNLKVLKVFADQNLILIKGAIPGHKGAYVILEKK